MLEHKMNFLSWAEYVERRLERRERLRNTSFKGGSKTGIFEDWMDEDIYY